MHARAFIAAVIAAAHAAGPTSADTPHGTVVQVGSKFNVELAVAGESSFRVSVRRGAISPASQSQTIESPMIPKASSFADFKRTSKGSVVGLTTSFGSVTINADSAEFTLSDANGKALAGPKALVPAAIATSSSNSSCDSIYPGHDISGGDRTPGCPDGKTVKDQGECCAACDKDPDCKVFIFATSQPSNGNCWLMKSITGITQASNRNLGGAIPDPPMELSLGKSANALFYGSGGGSGNARTLQRTSSSPKVTNTEFDTPSYWTTDGYRAVAVSSVPYSSDCPYCYPVGWSAGEDSVSWQVGGGAEVDLYLAPAATMKEGVQQLWKMSGPPAMPPRYAFGFLACRWGWENDGYILDILKSFRNGSYPLDAFISDFEWFTITPDYTVPDQGVDGYTDFGYNNVTFPNPQDQLKLYHDELKVRFGGIRKPRLGNKDLLVMARSKNWTVNAQHGGGAPGHTRNLNYSIPALRDWYSEQQAHYLKDGVDFFWNDEGETYYFAFHYWNVAEVSTQTKHSPDKRFWSINRAFTLGMQRIAATTWTGDIGVSWDSLQNQPGYMLNWGLAGTNFVTCDTGGFSGGDDTALLLTRWYQYSAFSPVMRVHSTRSDKPHFPFLYGEEAGNAMRKALNMRYAFIPYHYSIAHASYSGDGPMMRPMVMEFGSDNNTLDLTAQWMDGPSVLVAPVTNDQNTTSVYLPESTEWFEFNSTAKQAGPKTIQLDSVALDKVPVYVKAGSILPLTNGEIQYSDQLPAGPITVQVYPGADCTFTLVEDDGETLGYQGGGPAGDAQVRRTVFEWKDAEKTLTWKVNGVFSDSHTFAQVQAVAFFPEGAAQKPAQAIGKSGSIKF